MQVGDIVDVELLPVEPGQAVDLDRVLMINADGAVKVGQPVVPGAVVRTKVVDNVKGEKVIIFKYKPKVRYRRRVGHRQPLHAARGGGDRSRRLGRRRPISRRRPHAAHFGKVRKDNGT